MSCLNSLFIETFFVDFSVRNSGSFFLIDGNSSCINHIAVITVRDVAGQSDALKLECERKAA